MNAKPPMISRTTTRRGFTLVELLVVIAILGILAIIAVPQLIKAKEKAVIKEALSNIMNISGEVERFHADGNFSYTTGDAGGGCPDNDTYTSNGTAVGILPLAIQGDYYSYNITTTDPNGDGLCENYTVTATGSIAPATANTAGPISYNQNGVKTGPWR